MGLSREWKDGLRVHYDKGGSIYTPIKYYSGDKSQTMGWVRHIESMGESRGSCRVLVRNPKGKRPLGRCRHVWEDNIKMLIQQERYGNGLD